MPDNKYFSSVGGVLYDKDVKKIVFCPEGIEIVDIPDSIEMINDNAFSECRKMTKVTIPDSVVSIGMNAFFSMR
ncbi:MAG: leucine-rich repeat protein [Ruminococcus sp.]|nr:leucine-rich repeat protein [Ruminococcus sp.]